MDSRSAVRRVPASLEPTASRTKDPHPPGRTSAIAPAPTRPTAAAEARASVDPLRGTDRYRLVMPYTQRL